MGRKRKIDPFEIDVEEEVLGEDYKVEQVIVQLRKIVDSIGNPSSLHWVQTDKGGKVWVGHKNAKMILRLFDLSTNRAAKDMSYVSNRMRPEYIAAQTRAKSELTEKLQTAAGLKALVKFVKDNERLLVNGRSNTRSSITRSQTTASCITVKRQQVALQHTDFSEDFAPGMAPLTKYAYYQRGMDLAFEGILKSLRDTIMHEADIKGL
jgi:hypothetical protein